MEKVLINLIEGKQLTAILSACQDWENYVVVPFMGGGVIITAMSDEQLRIASAQSGIGFELLKAQQRAEMASAVHQGVEGEKDMLIPTVEIQLKQNPKNPRNTKEYQDVCKALSHLVTT